MKNQTPTTPDTKNTTASSYTSERDRVRKILDKLEAFHDLLAEEHMIAAESGVTMPVLEAPIEIIEHFSRGTGMLQAFKKNKYFIYGHNGKGAIICEEGTREEVENELELSHREEPDARIARMPKEAAKQPAARFKRVTTPPY